MAATSGTARRQRALAAAMVGALGLLIGIYCYTKFVPGIHHRVLWLEGTTMGPFLVAVFLLSRVRLSRRATLLIILGVGIALQIVAMCAPPTTR